MNGLKSVAGDIRSRTQHGFPVRLSECTAVEAALVHLPDPLVGKLVDTEELITFLQRMSSEALSRAKSRDLNLLLSQVWQYPDYHGLGLKALVEARRREKRSHFRSTIAGYLQHFPVDHPVCTSLANAAKEAATYLGEPWAGRGETWRLWHLEDGPSTVGKALVEFGGPRPHTLLEKLGFGSRIFSTRFGDVAFDEACRAVALMRDEAAVDGQRRLLEMFAQAKEGAVCTPILAFALLRPWLNQNPGDDHRKHVTNFLVESVGDPRIAVTRWANLERVIADKEGPEAAYSLVSVLRRWLTDAAMRTFFRAIASTTERRDQWDERERFWLGYLEAGHISDAWFALGPRAKEDIRKIIAASGERVDFATLNTGGGSDASHSSLLMKLGDLVIAEWSHNGACRFWGSEHPQAPKFFGKTYETRRLKAMADGGSFFHISHMSNWQARFAGQIYRATNLRHPVFGRGY
ncbi:hypothetical protein D1224_10890 [Henriciella barbarensis]|uniref:Zorya protein ZorC EH domain-containing protein n=1 Tax=Henriciella barbarensis TaxID=86342 RepID=A0A399QUC3_9PROT|nr:EH signature domain-containing protein [Henriciella barbarensis]RIJ22071.1 hypothetical protein D1224_10890 [Henriciella barbarensis]